MSVNSTKSHAGKTAGEIIAGPTKTPLWVTIVKWAAILGVLAIAAIAVQRLIDLGWWIGVVIAGAIGSAVLVVYGRKKGIALKFLIPGLLLMLALQVWPVMYTAATSFTNQGPGHMLSKEEAIDAIIFTSVREVPNSPRYAMAVAVEDGQSPETGDLLLLLTDPTDGSVYVGTGEGLELLDDPEVVLRDNGAVASAPGYTLLNAREINDRDDFRDIAVPTETGGIRPQGLSQAYDGVNSMVYDEASDTMTDTLSGKVYIADEARFIPEDGIGQPLPQGWKINVGFSNFLKILTDPTIRNGFLGIFVWNVAFAVLSVLTTFLLGMMLAILFNDPVMKGKKIYRAILILPYAIPGFITALVWKSMFNPRYGLINDMLNMNINWIGDPTAAKAAILITNLWLGFPYMFIVCTGALQSIPEEIYEAARIDRIGPMRQLWSITMPLLLVSVGPLLVASFSFNFNNFGLIYLLTEGGPFSASNTDMGQTDILITFAYRMAFSGTNPNFGMASAVSILIFLLVASMSLVGFRKSIKLEDVN